ncbi:cell division protein ZipA [Psychromonas sp. B3M02]|uniref:cell division protein ZipA n=1 Tax=Psychromonas sp. B3M02 TaxID=2267226 RepID=UPI000DEB91A9|nr:cell division protein ZipA [Psychromonas sp. B3M02]RBW46049.1 cell division protein ZipA [Psychromonas sp. B3M02]
MQHFQSILIVIGILAIAGVLIHGFLLNRKNKQALKAEQQAQLDELAAQAREEEAEQEPVQANPKMSKLNRDYDSVAFSTNVDDQHDESDAFHFNVQQKEKPTAEPVVVSTFDDLPIQEHIDMVDALDDDPAIEVETEKTASVPEETDLFIFNVVAKNGGQLGGHELLQFFLTSGFRFGDMNIFHRHEHSDGTGEVLFSIANMMAPGTFDLEYMEQFNSPGISFFFTAPNKNISVNKSFDMMLRAVEQVAEEFDCEVLNDKREKFTTEQFIEYRTRLEKYA